MDNIKIGDRVVDRTSGKHGVVHSFYKPLSFGYRSKTKARVVTDNGNVIDVEPHNLSKEEGFKKETFDPVGINALKNPNDKAENLTPVKPKRKKKETKDETVEQITDAIV